MQGFHLLLGGLQFTLAIGKLRSTVYMANEQRGSSELLATQTSIVHGPNKSIKVTSVRKLVSSFTSGASAPYFWRYVPEKQKVGNGLHSFPGLRVL